MSSNANLSRKLQRALNQRKEIAMRTGKEREGETEIDREIGVQKHQKEQWPCEVGWQSNDGLFNGRQFLFSRTYMSIKRATAS